MKKNKNSFEEFRQQILCIESKKKSFQDTCEEIVLLANSFLSKKRTEITNTGFKSKKEEIQFFKIDKQLILNNLIYYSEVWKIASRLALFDRKYQLKYLKSKICEINLLLVKHLVFIQYIDSGRTYLDEHYFLRRNFDYFAINIYELGIFDPTFNTSHDRLLGKLNASKRLLKYIQYKINDLGTEGDYLKTGLKWTTSKISLTELIYALHSARVINNGNVTLKQIAESFQQIFNFEVGDIYRTYSEIRARKKGRVKFLNELESAVINSMEKIDN